jgi:hypothetical protein
MGTTLYKLYQVEYEIMKTGKTFLCKSVGTSEKDVIFDLFQVVGGIKVENIFYLSDVHLITGTVKQEIIERSLMSEKSKRRIGRPRKYEFIGE